MPILRSLQGPADLRALPADQLPVLAAEIRDALVTSVARTGGHLGPNLGAVELTIALHRVFDSPREPIVFDTGHQSYVHKMLTGRVADFDRLRQRDGLSGYPSREESEHDWVENSHASTALSYADGLAKAFAVRGECVAQVGRVDPGAGRSTGVAGRLRGVVGGGGGVDGARHGLRGHREATDREPHRGRATGRREGEVDERRQEQVDRDVQQTDREDPGLDGHALRTGRSTHRRCPRTVHHRLHRSTDLLATKKFSN